MSSLTLSDQHFSYIRTETIISIVINVIISLVFVWLVLAGRSSIGMWGMDGMAFDLIPTTFMITLMTNVAVGGITRSRLRKNAVSALDYDIQGPAVLQFVLKLLPANFFLRGVVLGLLMTLILVPLMIAILLLLSVTSMSAETFAVYKALYGAFLSILVTPIILITVLKS